MAITQVTHSGGTTFSGTLGIYSAIGQIDGNPIDPSVQTVYVIYGGITCQITAQIVNNYWVDCSIGPGYDGRKYVAQILQGSTILEESAPFCLSIRDVNFAEFDFDFTVYNDSYIDRTEGIGSFMGSTTGPTHSVERSFTDGWVANDSPGTVTVSFGSLSTTQDLPEGYVSPVAPISGGNIMIYRPSGYGDHEFARWDGLSFDAFAATFDGYKIYKNNGMKTYATGSSIINCELNSTGVTNCGDAWQFHPPYIKNYSQIGVGNWQDTDHNAAYNNLLVWTSASKKVPYLNGSFTWPAKADTQIGGTGDFAYGDGCPVRLGELRALGKFNLPVLPNSLLVLDWVHSADYDYGFFDDGTAMSCVIDQKSAEDHNIYRHSTTDYAPTVPQYIVFGVPDLTKTLCNVDPEWNTSVTHSDVSVDLSGDIINKRASTWNSNEFEVVGGGIDSTGTPTFTVPITGGSLKRTLVDNWYSRCNSYISSESWNNFPLAYIYHKANRWAYDHGNPSEDWFEPNEDVYWWNSHRYLEIDLTPAETPVNKHFTTTITYSTETVEDDHATGTTRQVACDLIGSTIRVYSNNWSSDLIWIDLWDGIESSLQHVSNIEIAFRNKQIVTVDIGTNVFTCGDHLLANGTEVWITSNGTIPSPLVESTTYYVISVTDNTFKLSNTLSGSEINITTSGSGTIEIVQPTGVLDWTLAGLWLRRHSNNDPDRLEVVPHALATFHEPKHDYFAGGCRGNIDGRYREALVTSGNFLPYSGAELLVEHINWVYGGVTAIDMSAAWSFGAYMNIMDFSCEGWEWTVPNNWSTVGGMRIDSESTTLTSGYSFDMKELQDYRLDNNGNPALDNLYPCRFAASSWTIARNLEYKPYGVLIVEGGIHLLSTERSYSGGSIYRREYGSGDAWTTLPTFNTDGHGYWSDGYALIKRYLNDLPKYWEYRVNDSPFNVEISRLYERQFMDAVLRFGSKTVFAILDPTSNVMLMLVTK